jgi:flavin reductase (DIM6/NTAB) family NADH-FMN oxidoreductase RutF
LKPKKKRDYPLAKVYGLMETGPTVMISTRYRDQVDIMTQSWHTMLEFEPPLIGCVVSNRNFSFSLLKASKECVINIPTVEIADAVVGCGNTSGSDVDKFKEFGLTAVPGKLVGAPLIGECYANLECKVVDTRMVTQYGFFVLEVVKAWIDPKIKDARTIHHQGYGTFMVAGERVHLSSKMR